MATWRRCSRGADLEQALAPLQLPVRGVPPPYHGRSNVESTFSIIKRAFGGTLRSKDTETQTNELLMKVIAHNIVCVVHSIFELGVNVPE